MQVVGFEDAWANCYASTIKSVSALFSGSQHFCLHALTLIIPEMTLHNLALSYKFGILEFPWRECPKMFNSKALKTPEYNLAKLSNTWSQKTYKKYLTADSTWQWSNFPNFSARDSIKEKCAVPEGGSVLEIGCAAGGAYRFLSSNGAVDQTTDYSGFDISDFGIEHCKKTHPNATWVQADVTNHNFDRRYDFTFERIAVHHMPDPLSVFDKLAAVTNKSLATGFVSCLKGTTISDLSLARYRHANGEMVYFDIINPFEVCEVLLDHGFRKFEFVYRGAHEKIDNFPLAHQYLSPEISRVQRMIGRTTIVATKTDSEIETVFHRGHPYNSSPLLVPLRALKGLFTGRWSHARSFYGQLVDFKNRTGGVVISSRYDGKDQRR